MFPLIDNNFPNFGFSQRPNRCLVDFGTQNSDAFLHNWIAFERVNHCKTGGAFFSLIKKQHAGRAVLHLSFGKIDLERMPLQGRDRLLDLRAAFRGERRPILRPQQHVILCEIENLCALRKLQGQSRKRCCAQQFAPVKKRRRGLDAHRRRYRLAPSFARSLNWRPALPWAHPRAAARRLQERQAPRARAP